MSRLIDADEFPTRHGYNATDTHPSDQFICSLCGFSCEITEIKRDDDFCDCDRYEYDCRFCPECGAKMGAQDGNEKNG